MGYDMSRSEERGKETSNLKKWKHLERREQTLQKEKPFIGAEVVLNTFFLHNSKGFFEPQR